MGRCRHRPIPLHLAIPTVLAVLSYHGGSAQLPSTAQEQRVHTEPHNNDPVDAGTTGCTEHVTCVQLATRCGDEHVRRSCPVTCGACTGDAVPPTALPPNLPPAPTAPTAPTLSAGKEALQLPAQHIHSTAHPQLLRAQQVEQSRYQLRQDGLKRQQELDRQRRDQKEQTNGGAAQQQGQDPRIAERVRLAQNHREAVDRRKEASDPKAQNIDALLREAQRKQKLKLKQKQPQQQPVRLFDDIDWAGASTTLQCCGTFGADHSPLLKEHRVSSIKIPAGVKVPPAPPPAIDAFFLLLFLVFFFTSSASQPCVDPHAEVRAPSLAQPATSLPPTRPPPFCIHTPTAV